MRLRPVELAREYDVADDGIEWFQATGNKVWGIAAMLFGAAVAVIAILSGAQPALPIGAVLFAVLAYVSMWRPRIGATRDTLLLRDMYSTRKIPLAAIDSIIITRTFAAHVVGRNYVSGAIGRGLRESVHGKKRSKGASQPAVSYCDIVEGRITNLLDRARLDAQAPQGSEKQSELARAVRRIWSWPEIVASAVVAVAFVGSFLI